MKRQTRLVAGVFVGVCSLVAVAATDRLSANAAASQPNPGSTANIAMTPGGTVFLEDDFATEQRLPLIDDKLCSSSYREGGLMVQTPSGCEWFPGDLAERPMRARFEVSVRILKGEIAGLIVGRSSRADGLHYHFEVDDQGQFGLEMAQNNKATALIPWGASAALRTQPGATNRLAIEVLEQELRCFINGRFVGRAASPQVVQGQWGFIVRGNSGSAVYSNLKIVDLSGPRTTASEARPIQPIARGNRAPASPGPVESGTARTTRRPNPFE